PVLNAGSPVSRRPPVDVDDLREALADHALIVDVGEKLIPRPLSVALGLDAVVETQGVVSQLLQSGPEAGEVSAVVGASACEVSSAGDDIGERAKIKLAALDLVHRSRQLVVDDRQALGRVLVLTD